MCDDPLVAASRIDKPIILDIEDKTAARPKPYTKENLIEYEIMTRDSRIGEITNAATSIENRYTTEEAVRKRYEDAASLLRVFQGKEIDFLKTGVRWHMNSALKKHLKQLPYFLLYHYPDKMDTYKALRGKKKQCADTDETVTPNAYHSPSPMNELCDYICTWEKKHILWDKGIGDLADTARLVVNDGLDLTDKNVLRICRRYINHYAANLKTHLSQKKDGKTAGGSFHYELVVNEYKAALKRELSMDEALIANYVIKASYASVSISKSFAWAAYGDYLLQNLREHSGAAKRLSIQEVPGNTKGSYEYLGKYYELREGDNNIRM